MQLLKASPKATHSNKGYRNQRILLTLKFVIEASICGVGCMVLSLTFSLVQAISCSWCTAYVIMMLLEVVYFSRMNWPVCMCCLPFARSVCHMTEHQSQHKQE